MIKTQDKPDVLTVKEVAEFLRIPEATVRQYASRLAIPGRQLGKEWRFSRMAPEEWLRGASGKEILFSQAGSFEDDVEGLAALRASIYKDRGQKRSGLFSRIES